MEANKDLPSQKTHMSSLFIQQREVYFDGTINWDDEEERTRRGFATRKERRQQKVQQKLAKTADETMKK